MNLAFAGYKELHISQRVLSAEDEHPPQSA